MFRIIFPEPFQLRLTNGAAAGEPLLGEYDAIANEGQQPGWFSLHRDGVKVANLHIDLDGVVV